MLLKYTSDDVRFVFIPMIFLFLFVTYTFVGISNWFPVGEVDIEIFDPLYEKITGSLFENGWFSI